MAKMRYKNIVWYIGKSKNFSSFLTILGQGLRRSYKKMSVVQQQKFWIFPPGSQTKIPKISIAAFALCFNFWLLNTVPQNLGNVKNLRATIGSTGKNIYPWDNGELREMRKKDKTLSTCLPNPLSYISNFQNLHSRQDVHTEKGGFKFNI